MTTRNPRPGIVSLVNPDPQDARDREFVPADPSGPLPDRVSCDAYRRYVGTTWHQRGQECTGFALAAVANYTLRRRADDPALPGVSRRMLYEMAQFYDGEAFKEGSTLRGALKGWRRVGVTRDDLWPYSPRDEEGTEQGGLTLARLLDARARRLLRYERIATEDIRTMQHALAEGRALYASASYHVGWFRLYIPGVEPEIVQRPDDAMRGGHAFVIAGYDERGFWIHNSFGPGWGDGGYARLPYEDWQANGRDVWVIEAEDVSDASGPVLPATRAGQAPAPPAYQTMWSHLVVLRDDGTLGGPSPWEMDAATVRTLLYLFQERTSNWSQRRLAVIADGGYLPLAETVERLGTLREAFMAREIYPIFLVWETSCSTGACSAACACSLRTTWPSRPTEPARWPDRCCRSWPTASRASRSRWPTPLWRRQPSTRPGPSPSSGSRETCWPTHAWCRWARTGALRSRSCPA
jgi:hypothetical protein